MKQIRLISFAITLVILALVGCSISPTNPATPVTGNNAVTTKLPSLAASPTRQTTTSTKVAESGSAYQVTNFSHPLTIDNKWTPMVPGTAMYYAGTVNQGNKQELHGIISNVTDLTKEIDGVKTSVVWERDFSNGVLAESELFFVAQEDNGTVWLLGEYPAIYEGGQFTGAPDTWIPGLLYSS